MSVGCIHNREFACADCQRIFKLSHESSVEQPSTPPQPWSPHPSGIEHGCPYDYSDPETNRILAEERGSSVPVSGTFNCPICGYLESPTKATLIRCPECGGENGQHGWHFFSYGPNGFGEVVL
jgi:DNA-directed RNA polymerase subunit RPC12/RpoP